MEAALAAFEYLALDAGGRTLSGVLTAPDEASARRNLDRRRLVAVKLAETSAAPGVGGRRGSRLSGKELALATRQLSTLASVVPLEEALRTIAAQVDKPQARRVFGATHVALVEGRRLSEAMALQGNAFPPLYRAMVAAGESSSALPQILERLADLLEKEQQVRGKVVTALVYPAMLAATAVLVITALMSFVVPKVVDQFDSMGQTLPLLTRIVIGLSDVMRAYGWIAALLMVAGGLVFARALKHDAFRLKVDRAILAMPFVGRLVRDVHAARLARTLATMLASGLPVLEGLQITARTVRNGVLRDATLGMATQIREGGSISGALKRAGVFPPILVYMAASGESSGKLEPMLARAADYLEQEFATFTAVALSLLEPGIIILMGGVVALIVLSILLPILQINSLALG
jgi:general secretion pathway protein F